ncbi:ABC transporter ATP-binding protein [Roseibium aestuarii]|uniref:Spermidine/putrescine import ATP-binding protein PotA n=1 Tax=Roseibium aestuarii TaxID=2600299 RepID=A0ABW4JY51_9HYPH|nr:ABC transporter ATP-binding protein [Roseibium aestuarii]
MIEVIGVTKVFPGPDMDFTALGGVSLTVQDNEFFTLLGPSGCGKTTLLRVIAGFEYPTSGSVLLDGKDLLAQPPYRRPVNTVFQSYALFPHMSVAENIAFGLEMLNKPKAEIRKTVADMLDLVRMTPMADRKTSEISGGQQQRVALARALAPRPKVLLLDEPLSALDYKLRKDMQLELKRLQAETGITFIFVTHDQEEALTMSDRIAVMNAGTVRQIGSPREIYDQPSERFVADFIGETNFITADLVGVEGDGSGLVRVRLAGGVETHVQAPSSDLASAMSNGPVTLAIRPEHAILVDEPQGLLKGALENVVYFGTDTHFHVALDDGGLFVLRQQNQPGQRSDMSVGDRVGLSLGRGVGQILRD